MFEFWSGEWNSPSAGAPELVPLRERGGAQREEQGLDLPGEGAGAPGGRSQAEVLHAPPVPALSSLVAREGSHGEELTPS